MNFQKTTLDNGLEIIAESNESSLSTALGFFVKTGARDETDEISGVSHFLEHMVFKGTSRRSAEDVNRELDELGGDSNAFTSEESTAFYAKTLPDLVERAVDLLGDVMRPALRQEDFDTEKRVVLEEIRMYEDQPPFGIDEKSREYFWRGHPLARSVLGTRESVGNLSPEAMREYFERRYSPSNIVFVASGQVDFGKLVGWVADACGKWKPFDAGREIRKMRGIRETRIIRREKTTQEYALQLVDAPSCVEDARFAAAVLATILGDEVGSRLFWELVDSGKADSAALYFNAYSDLGCFTTSLACRPEDVESNLRTISDVLEEARRDGVTEEELNRARNKMLASAALSAERPIARLFAIGGEWLATGRYRSVEDDLAVLRKITLDDVNEVTATYPLANPFTIAVGPLDSVDV